MNRYEIILQKPIPPDEPSAAQSNLDVLSRVEEDIKNHGSGPLSLVRGLLENAGFTDITENPDHTFNATKDGFRYIQMYLSGYDPVLPETDAVKIENVSYTYWKKGPFGIVTTRLGRKSLEDGFLHS